MTSDKVDAEAVTIGPGHTAGPAGQDLPAVAADLLTTNGGQLQWGKPFVAEVAVHVCGGRVAGIAGVDDDHGPALAGELVARRPVRLPIHR